MIRENSKSNFAGEKLATCVGLFFNASFIRCRDNALFRRFGERGNCTHIYRGTLCQLLASVGVGEGGIEMLKMFRYVYLFMYFLFFYLFIYLLYMCIFFVSSDMNQKQFYQMIYM